MRRSVGPLLIALALSCGTSEGSGAGTTGTGGSTTGAPTTSSDTASATGATTGTDGSWSTADSSSGGSSTTTTTDTTSTDETSTGTGPTTTDTTETNAGTSNSTSWSSTESTTSGGPTTTTGQSTTSSSATNSTPSTTDTGSTTSQTTTSTTTGALVWVRVMTWNVETVGDPGTTEYDAALAVLGRLEPDVVALNEIASAADAADLGTLATDAGYANVVVPPTNPFGADRNAFLSHFPLVESEYHTSADLSGDPQANDITRLLVRVVVDVPGTDTDLTLVSNHWKSGTANSDEFRRAVESLRSAQTVASLDPVTGAFVVMGDVNEEIDNVPQTPDPFVALPGGLPAAFDLGADLEAVLAGPGIANDPFAPLEDPSSSDMTALDLLQLDGTDATRPSSGRRLDYVFVSQALMDGVPVGEVYDSDDEGLPGGLLKYGAALAAQTSLDASDHLPVVVDVPVP